MLFNGTKNLFTGRDGSMHMSLASASLNTFFLRQKLIGASFVLSASEGNENWIGALFSFCQIVICSFVLLRVLNFVEIATIFLNLLPLVKLIDISGTAAFTSSFIDPFFPTWLIRSNKKFSHFITIQRFFLSPESCWDLVLT